jgi:hypothetical protein
MTPEELIIEAEGRAIKGGRSVDLLTAIWAITVAAEGGLRKVDPDDWHDCPTCGLNHRKMP